MIQRLCLTHLLRNTHIQKRKKTRTTHTGMRSREARFPVCVCVIEHIITIGAYYELCTYCNCNTCMFYRRCYVVLIVLQNLCSFVTFVTGCLSKKVSCFHSTIHLFLSCLSGLQGSQEILCIGLLGLLLVQGLFLVFLIRICIFGIALCLVTVLLVLVSILLLVWLLSIYTIFSLPFCAYRRLYYNL